MELFQPGRQCRRRPTQSAPAKPAQQAPAQTAEKPAESASTYAIDEIEYLRRQDQRLGSSRQAARRCLHRRRSDAEEVRAGIEDAVHAVAQSAAWRHNQGRRHGRPYQSERCVADPGATRSQERFGRDRRSGAHLRHVGPARHERQVQFRWPRRRVSKVPGRSRI